VRAAFNLVVSQNLEREVEAPIEFILPVLRGLPGQTTRQRWRSPRGDQFFHQKAGHNCLAGTRIVGEQKP